MKNIITLILCLLVISLNAQKNDVANWTQHQFLDEVNDIAETETDMWFATNLGLVRMDKASQEKELYHSLNSPLPRNHIEAVTVSADGQLFIGIYDNIIARFDGVDDWDITELPVDESVLSANQMPLLYTILIDDENEKWAGTNSGLLHQSTSGEWEIFNDATLGNNGVVSFRDVWDIAQTENGDIFVSSFELYKYDGENFTNLSEGNNDLFSYGGTSIESHGDDIWFNNAFSVMARYTADNWEIYTNDGTPDGLPSGIMTDVKLDASGIPYVLYESPILGLYKFENELWSQVTDEQTSTIYSSINSLYFDENNDRWITAQDDVFYKTQENYTEIDLHESPLVNTTTRFVKETPDGSIYCYSEWTTDRKLVRFDSPTTWEEVPLSDNFTGIRDMEINSAGDIIVTTIQGVFQYQNETWEQIPNFPALIPGKLAIDSEDEIWVITLLDGLHHHDGNTWETYTMANSDLDDDLLRNVYTDRNGGVWVVTSEENLQYFDGVNWELFTQDNAPFSQSISSRDAYFDENNELWLPLFDGNILHYDGEDWETFTHEIEDNVIASALTADPQNRLYSTTTQGVFQFDETTWQPFLNIENSLLQTNGTHDIVIDKNGFFWISTTEGLTVYDSEIISAINNPEILDQNFFTISPNPTTDFISIRLEDIALQNFDATIYDASGRLLRNEKITSGEQMRVMDLANGIYYLKLNGEKKSYVGKFVKE